VRAGHQHRAAARDEARIDVVGNESHVGAALAIEHVRKVVAPADGEEDEGREAVRIGADLRDIDAFARERGAHEAAILLVADPRHHGDGETQPRGPDGGVRRRAAEISREGGHVLEPDAELLAIEVDRGAADAGEVEARFAHARRRARALRVPACSASSCPTLTTSACERQSGSTRERKGRSLASPRSKATVALRASGLTGLS
jgi:hypothetical protein